MLFFMRLLDCFMKKMLFQKVREAQTKSCVCLDVTLINAPRLCTVLRPSTNRQLTTGLQAGNGKH